MKICLITNSFSPDLIGGSNVYTSVIARELRDRNHEVVVIAASSGKNDSTKYERGVKIHYFHPANIATSSEIGKRPILSQGLWTILDIYNYYSYAKLIKILKRENPDIVHLHTPLDITLSVFDAVKRLNLPLIFTAHDYLLLCRRVILLHKSGEVCTDKNVNKFCGFYRSLTKKIVDNKADVVIFPSEFICQMFRRHGFFEKTKKVILPHPVRLNNAGLRTDNAVINKPNLNILYVGSLTRHKGIQILIEAVRRIKKDNLRLAIVGSGRYKDKLEDMANSDKRIAFYGKISNDDIEVWYNKADVLVVPSVWNEVFGIVILEAFRAGVPVIASSIGGIPEVVKDNYNGFLFEPGDVDQLKQVLESIIENPEVLARLGNNAKNYAKQYEMSGYIKKLVLNYEEAIRLNRMRRRE